MKSIRKFLFILLFTQFSTLAFAAPKSDLWPFWQKSNQQNTQSIDHSTWQKIISKNLVVKGQDHLFDYANISASDKTAIKQYIKNLSSVDPRSYNKNVQFAYWVNLYNALTVNLIIENYPLSSITKLGGFFSFGPWDQSIIKVAGQTLTLNDIEHRILRPIWKDERIHYVVNCASLGCPNLATTALTETNLETELNKAASAFINSAKGVSIQGNTLTLSSIFDWYAVDFGMNQAQILATIDKYRQGQKLQGWRGRIRYDYDWDLNKQ